MILDILDYVRQMVPLGLVALVILILLRPVRVRRLEKLGLASPAAREAALVLFVVFCAGLAALTLFPANLWAYVFDWLFRREIWSMSWSGLSLLDFYPKPGAFEANLPYLSQMLTPFEEISRALNRRSYWLMFMLLGNIIMFMPIGFFPALLWRRWRWWKSLLAGLLSSCAIEFTQFFIGRSTDIDDVILNTFGALAGFWIYWLVRALAPRLTELFQCQSRGGRYHG